MPKPAEIELKLAVVSGRPARVARRLSDSRFKRVVLDDWYFDTPSADLRRRSVVLRVRRDGERWLQTLKTGKRSRELVPERGEWEVELAQRGRRPPLDLKRFGTTPLRRLKRSEFDPRQLQPMFRSRVERRRGMLLHAGSRIEVALDHGELTARVGDKMRRYPVSEVELELKRGKPADVLDLARQLVSRQGMPRMVPALRSKAERGYALALDEELSTVRASARAIAAGLDAGMSSAAALRAVVRNGLAIVVANADALRMAPAPELVHQSRVALRRMRSAIRLLDPDHEDLPERLADGLRWLARTLGRARDLDVLLDTTLPGIALPDSAAAERLRKKVRRKRERALHNAVRAVEGTRYAKLALAIAQWTMTPPPSGTRSLAERAAPSLHVAADRVFVAARGFTKLPQHARHKVRILAKRLRYALDLLAIALPRQAVSDYIDALADLQDVLGELNDTGVAFDCLLPLTDSRRIRNALRTWHGEAQAAHVETAVGKLGALARRARPWDALTLPTASGSQRHP